MESTLGIIGGALVVAAALGLSWPVWRSRNTSATLELLRSELAVEREAREALARRCAEDTAELRGQVSVLSSHFAEQLAETVAERIAGRIAEAILAALGTAGIIDRRGAPSSRAGGASPT